MNDADQINHAIASHSRFKARLKDAIESGKREWTADSVRADNLCEFGKWLYSCSSTERATERWRRIRDLHADLHKEAGRVLAIAIAGRKAEAQAALALGTYFSKTSAELTLALVDWRDSIGGRQ